jgi:flagellin
LQKTTSIKEDKMGLVISSNFAASYAARQIEINNDGLQKSLNRLSSGKRIVNPVDDAGGMAVQLKMQAAIKRGAVTKNNIQNAISFLQTQDGVLQTATSVVDRIAELKAMSLDATKNSEDIQNYNEEYQVLRQQLVDLQSEEFNAVSIFTVTQGLSDTTKDGVYTIYTSEQGNKASAPSVLIKGVHLSSTGGDVNHTNASVYNSISNGFSGDVISMTSGGLASTALSMDGILSDLQNLANARAVNGALQSRMSFAYDQASISKINMEAARSRIIDVDIAEESSNFARQNIMMQASSSMLAQANTTSRTALQLLLQ